MKTEGSLIKKARYYWLRLAWKPFNNEASFAIVREVVKSPLDEHEYPILETNQVEKVDEQPDNPGREAAKPKFAENGHSAIPADGCQSSFVRVAKRSTRLAVEALANQAAEVGSLLHRHGDEPGYAALVRIEQLYPFPLAALRDALIAWPRAAEVVWVQEEPRNMGARRFVQEQMQPSLARTNATSGRSGRSSTRR